MNRIDNTHATFLNCLRDWNDPFLLGHKPTKLAGCQRCESCACRSAAAAAAAASAAAVVASNHGHGVGSFTPCNSSTANTSTISTTTTSNITLPHMEHTICSRNKRESSKSPTPPNITNSTQGISRCKSSTNVPKTIDQCIKLCKSRPRPASIKPQPHSSRKVGTSTTNETKTIGRSPNTTNKNILNLNISKISNNSLESDDKESTTDTVSKEDDLKLYLVQFAMPNIISNSTTIYDRLSILDEKKRN